MPLRNSTSTSLCDLRKENCVQGEPDHQKGGSERLEKFYVFFVLELREGSTSKERHECVDIDSYEIR